MNLRFDYDTKRQNVCFEFHATVVYHINYSSCNCSLLHKIQLHETYASITIRKDKMYALSFMQL